MLHAPLDPAIVDYTMQFGEQIRTGLTRPGEIKAKCPYCWRGLLGRPDAFDVVREEAVVDAGDRVLPESASSLAATAAAVVTEYQAVLLPWTREHIQQVQAHCRVPETNDPRIIVIEPPFIRTYKNAVLDPERYVAREYGKAMWRSAKTPRKDAAVVTLDCRRFEWLVGLAGTEEIFADHFGALLLTPRRRRLAIQPSKGTAFAQESLAMVRELIESLERSM